MGSSRSSFALVTLGNIAGAAAQWYVVWLFAQQSGPTAVGEYSTLIALMTPVFIASQFGLRNLYVTLQRQVRWRVYLGFRLSTVMISIVVIAVLVSLSGESLNSGLAWAILAGKVCSSTADLYFARLQKAYRLTVFGTILLAEAVASTVAVTVSLIATGSIIVALWSSALISALGLVVTAWSSSPRFTGADPTAGPLPSGEVRALITAGIPMAIMQGVYSLLSYVPLAVVAWFGSADDVGRYASAAYLVVFANLVGASIETVVLPDFRRISENDGPAALRRRVKMRSFVLAGVLAPLIVVAVAVGPWLLQWVYGPQFVLSRTSVLFLAAAAVCTLPTYLMSANLLVLNRYWSSCFVGISAILIVLVSGGISGLLGLPAVEAGCLAVAIGSLTRYCGEFLLSRPRKGDASGLEL